MNTKAQGQALFEADEDDVLSCRCRCAENIVVSPVGQFQPLSQLVGGEGEIARGDVGLSDVFRGLAQLAFVHRGGTCDAHGASGEVLHVFVGDEEVAVGCDGLDGV